MFETGNLLLKREMPAAVAYVACREAPTVAFRRMSEETLSERYPRLADAAGGDTEMILEMLELFLEQTPELLQRLESGLAPFDRTVLHTASHTLKPTLRYVGMERLYELSLEIERDAKNERVPAHKLIRRSKELRSELETELENIRVQVWRNRSSLS